MSDTSTEDTHLHPRRAQRIDPTFCTIVNATSVLYAYADKMTSGEGMSIDIHMPGSAIPSLSPHSLSKSVHARRAEYTRPQTIRLKVGSWNVAACPRTEQDLGAWFIQEKGLFANLTSWDDSDDGLESTGLQEDQRRNKKLSTVPNDKFDQDKGGDEVDMYVLGLQEVVDVNSAREYIGRVYTDPEPTTKWRKALAGALPQGYVQIVEQQLSGMLLFIYASSSLASSINSVSTVSVGTGIMGYLGNKGAIVTRIVLGETTRMVFVNSHLASGSDPTHFERRCWDVTQILQRTRFDPISWAGVLDDFQEGIGDEDFAFWFGDLNFRLEGLPGEDIRRLLMLHTQGEYGIIEGSQEKIEEIKHAVGPTSMVHSVEIDDDEDDSESASSRTDKPDDASSQTLPDPDTFMQDQSQDPTSLQATLDSIIPHDQLKHAQKTKKVFHDGWREGPITFLPTYKYDVGSVAIFDSSEKKRAPSWCDRILFRTRRDKLEHDEKLQEQELARQRDEEMRASGMDHAADDEFVLFDYDPEEDGAEDASSNHDGDGEYDAGGDDDSGAVIKKAGGCTDRINLDVYTSHQRVASSDHKPIDAVFILEYDAVVPELKSKIQKEVARDFDRAENEGRPGITVVVDHSLDDSSNIRSSLGADAINFGEVAYQQRKVRQLTLANTSQVRAKCAFVDRPGVKGDGEDGITPSWLSVRFVSAASAGQVVKDVKREVVLEPGDAINVTLELFVNDIELVRDLNTSKSQLDDILVLRITDGRDHFFPVRGFWLQSSFGWSIDELIRVPEGGVRALSPRGGSKSVTGQHDIRWSAPRELFKLTETIQTLLDRVIADSNMLANAHLPEDSPGWPFDSRSWLSVDVTQRESQRRLVLDALDADKNLGECFPPEVPTLERLEIISEVLLLFVRSLRDGIVPAILWSNFEQDYASRGTTSEEIKSWTLEILSISPHHNISFVFITSMLIHVVRELTPVLKSSCKSDKQNIDFVVRRSLSWKLRGTASSPVEDPAEGRRERTVKAFAEIFAQVIFKGGESYPIALKEKARWTLEERRRDILEAFLKV